MSSTKDPLAMLQEEYNNVEWTEQELEEKAKMEKRIATNPFRDYCDGCVAVWKGQPGASCIWKLVQGDVWIDGQLFLNKYPSKTNKQVREHLYFSCLAKLYGREGFDAHQSSLPICLEAAIKVSFPYDDRNDKDSPTLSWISFGTVATESDDEDKEYQMLLDYEMNMQYSNHHVQSPLSDNTQKSPKKNTPLKERKQNPNTIIDHFEKYNYGNYCSPIKRNRPPSVVSYKRKHSEVHSGNGKEQDTHNTFEKEFVQFKKCK